MYKKMNDTELEHILQTGIEEFAEKGLDRANINSIAKAAKVSVGVIYKYYKNKDNFFLHCVRYGLQTLDSTLYEAFDSGYTVKEAVYRLVRALIKCGREHGEYYVLYNEITSGSCKKYAEMLAGEIEGRTARLYEEMFKRAFSAKYADDEEAPDPKLASFLFDNMLMMLQFSYSCDYYKQRMKIFCGDGCFDDDEKLAQAVTDYLYRTLSLN